MSRTYSLRPFDSALASTSLKVLDIMAISMFMNTTDTMKVANKNINIIDMVSNPLVYYGTLISPRAPKSYTEMTASRGLMPKYVPAYVIPVP